MSVLRRRVVICSGAGVAVAVLWYFFPPFRITSIGDAKSQSAAPTSATAPLDVADYVDRLWNQRLPAAFGDAVDIQEFFAAVDRDVAEARSKFGRQVGLGGTYFFFIRGTGQVEGVPGEYCTLKIGEAARRVRIRTGVIVGNAVRDSTGLVDVNQFANSQDFNKLSAELNRRVETGVIAPSRERLGVGVHVDFVGCTQVGNDSDFDPLSLVPIRLDIENAEGQP